MEIEEGIRTAFDNEERDAIKKAVVELKCTPDFEDEFFLKVKKLSGNGDKYFPNMYDSITILEQMFDSQYPIEFCRKILANRFPCAEYTYTNKSKWIEWFRYCGFISDQNKNKPTDPLTVWRGGVGEHTIDGLSWTTDMKCAEWFAAKKGRKKGNPDDKPVLYRAIAEPNAILALLDAKQESECIIDPDKLTEIEKLDPDCKQFTKGFYFEKDFLLNSAFYGDVANQLVRRNYFQLIKDNPDLKILMIKLAEALKWVSISEDALDELDSIVKLKKNKLDKNEWDDLYWAYADDNEKNKFIALQKKCKKELLLAKKTKSKILCDLELYLPEVTQDYLATYNFYKGGLCELAVQPILGEISILNNAPIIEIKEQYTLLLTQINDRCFNGVL